MVHECEPRAAKRNSVSSMSPFLRTSAANLLLRGLTLGGKLLFLMLAARRLPVGDIAVYGLMTTTVGIAVTLTGLEFYAFSIREILARDAAAQSVCLRDQLVFHGIAYGVLLPLSVPVFASGILPWSLSGWFLILAIGEHVSQEITRILNALFRPVFATFLFFIRSTAWALVVVAIWLWRADSVDVTTIFAAWAAGLVVSLAIAVHALSRMDWRQARATPVNWDWIRRGIGMAAPFLLSAISYRVTELADRYILHFLLDDRAVGVYSFYGSIANVLPALVSATFSAILVPRVIQSYQAGNLSAYRRYFRTLSLGTVGISVAAIPVVFVAVSLLQPYLGRPEYERGLPTFGVLLASTAVAGAAQLPGIALYARRDDLRQLLAVLIAAVTNTVLNFVLIPLYGMIGAAWATVLAYSAMGLFQLYHTRRYALAERVSARKIS